MVDYYYYGGDLPEENNTYVKREADEELYEGLKAGKFCYVLNSSQSGKSSLRVRTMRRLRDDGVECIFIDLSSQGTKGISREEWYKGLAEDFSERFELDVNFDAWWQQNLSYSVVTRLRKLLEKILLAKIKKNIVIFIDEIGSVLSLDFPTDDFFITIRSNYNQRVDSPEYNRLTFCLLGIASPNDLIQDKKLTPFNIGKAIFLKPFQLGEEVEPLKNGLEERYSNSEQVIEEILKWTGGQPFLTQKLCHLMVREPQKENSRTVEQVVREKIIENWEFQDDPPHLQTIRQKIIKNKCVDSLLELYQRILNTEEFEIIADHTLEQYDLQLSGLVVREKNKLKVYNPIYKEIFDKDWIETQLQKFCPYAKNLEAWVASGCKDESRLLRGKTLLDAQEWSKEKSLITQHTQFLKASQNQEKEEELAGLEIEAALERERKAKEAAEQRNQVLAEANNTLNEAKKISKRQIRVGSIILGVTFLSSIILGNSTFIAYRTVQQQDQSILKIKEIFYEELENRLKKKEWEAADKLTTRVMWEIARTWEERSFSAEVSRNFPCEDLRTIDNLWTKYSKNRFGFSVQSRIWQSGEVNRNLGKFMSKVGWIKEVKQENGTVNPAFVAVTDFSLSNAPKGQLPWFVTWEGSDGIRDRTAYISRIESCGI